MGYQILSFLLDVAAGLLGGACLLRLYMQRQRVPFGNPIGRFVFALTDWLILPLRRVLPPMGRWDTASLVAAYLVELVQHSILWAVASQAEYPVVFLTALLGLVQLALSAMTALVIVYAILSCGRPGAEAVVFGAHYDSVRVAPGANDDGTGVVAVLATARELAKTKGRTRDLIFVFFDEEERGLVGSRNFAQMLKDQNRLIHSVHTIDQAGWDGNGNRAIELELPYDGAVALYKRAAAALGMTMPIWETTETGSDHSSFRRLGFKAIGITEEYRHNDTTPFIHKAGDTLATINFPYLASTTRLMIQVMTQLANDCPPSVARSAGSACSCRARRPRGSGSSRGSCCPAPGRATGTRAPSATAAVRAAWS